MASRPESRDRARRGTEHPPRTRRGTVEPRIRHDAPHAPAGADVESPVLPPDDAPRIVDEQRYIGPYGQEQDVVTDDRGRHFYSFRPVDAQRYDWLGFGWFWWLVVWAVIIGLIVWGWGWGY